MSFLAGMLKRFAMFGLVALWVAISAFQASAAVSAGGSHHGHTGVAAAPAMAASGHSHHEGMSGASSSKAESPRPCHAPDGGPVSADLSCCAAMCQATDIIPAFHAMIATALGTSYSAALAQSTLPFAAAGLERPPR